MDQVLATGTTARVAIILASETSQDATAEQASLTQWFPQSITKVVCAATFEFDNKEALKQRVRISIDRLRASQLQNGDLARVRHEGLIQAARTAGIPVFAAPTLSGPGKVS